MAKSADAFRTISEVADWLDTPAHVLRFWESKFSQVKPVKRAGGRRYYRPNDMLLLGGIKKLLHTDGMTIKGVQKLLRENGVKHVAAHSPTLDDVIDAQSETVVVEAPDTATTESSGTVLNFQREAAPDAIDRPLSPSVSSAENVEIVQEAHDSSSEVEDRVLPADEDPQPSASEPPATSVEDSTDPSDTTPVLPSFSHHRAQEEDARAEQRDPEPSKPDLKPAIVSVPDDPDDDIEADHGVLASLTNTPMPVSAEFADRLKPILDRMRQARND